MRFLSFPLGATRRLDAFRHLKASPVRIPVRMVEGPQCHRVAHAHRKALLGRAFKAVSPNQRFTEGARLIDGKPLQRIEVHGKNLFYFFGEGPSTVVMHIHFGMSGRFRVEPLPGPEPTPTTRLQLSNEALGVVANLSAMTVAHGDLEFYNTQSSKLGPDPLREDADVELVWSKVAASKKSVGSILMDQAMVAGIGNIYRAEILFKAGVHPEQPGNTVGREAFDKIWQHSVLLLQRGFKEGGILTVDREEAKVLGKPWTRRYIYNHPTCGRCKSAVQVWDINARTVYACPTCQPLTAETALTSARSQALGKATNHKKFKSVCAPDGPSVPPPQPASPAPKQPTVASLRKQLLALGQSASGNKAELVGRLAQAQTSPPPAIDVKEEEPEDVKPQPKKRQKRQQAVKQSSEAVMDAEVPLVKGQEAASSRAGPAADASAADLSEWSTLKVPGLKAALSERGLPTKGTKQQLLLRLQAALKQEDNPGSKSEVKPGIAGIKDVATAEEAAAEKRAAGEGLNVEHVAL